MPDAASRILAVNTGSSSLKAAVYRAPDVATPDQYVLVDRIGGGDSTIKLTDARGAVQLERTQSIGDFEAALAAMLELLTDRDSEHAIAAVGHRLVHGGLRFVAPQRITGDVLRELDDVARLAPEHMPQALVAVRFLLAALPGVPQIGCFDTSFHRAMPRVAQIFALPRALAEEGIVRYGFHGLSYESAMAALARIGERAARGRIVILHLGNGASMVAVRDGVGVDTTMGYTPTSGLVMGTRAGDVDPGVLLELIDGRRLAASEVNLLLNKRSGLLGISGTSRDMRDLLAAESSDARAAEAIALFCYRAKKYLGAYAAALGGLDTVVFTGGIGEHSAPIRARICEGLDFLGIALDADANAQNAALVSAENARVAVRVIRADEEGVIARHTLASLGAPRRLSRDGATADAMS
jgi:acetate kinase